MQSDGSERLVGRLRRYCGASLRAVIETNDSDEVAFHYVRDDYFAAHTRNPEEVEASMRRWASPPGAETDDLRASVTVFWDATTVHLPDGERTFSIVLEPDASGRLNEFVDWCRMQLA